MRVLNLIMTKTAADVEETDDQEEGKSSIEPKLESILRPVLLGLLSDTPGVAAAAEQRDAAAERRESSP